MKIYAAPIDAPETDYKNYDREKDAAQEADYLTVLANTLRSQGYTGPHTGKVLRVPFADGYAQYMVADGRSSCLIHLKLHDAWHSPDVAFLPKKEVLRRIDSAAKLRALFGAR